MYGLLHYHLHTPAVVDTYNSLLSYVYYTILCPRKLPATPQPYNSLLSYVAKFTDEAGATTIYVLQFSVELCRPAGIVDR